MTSKFSLFGGETAVPMKCSRAGCTQAATQAIVWRNPKIHSVDRRKTWLACDDHIDTLRDFLAARDFPLEVKEVSEL